MSAAKAAEDVPPPAGRAVYEAPLPDDQIVTIRAVLVDGRGMSTTSETVRTGGQCSGTVGFASGAAAAAEAGRPQGLQEPQPAGVQAEGGSGGLPGGAGGSGAQAQALEPQAQADPADGPAEGGSSGGVAPPGGAGEGGAGAAAESEPREPPLAESMGERPGEDAAAAAVAADGDEALDAGAVAPTGSAASEDATAPAAGDGSDGGGGCLVATAAYGTEIAPQVQRLREIRDGTLMTTESGRAFMSAFGAAYYSFSPHVADAERAHPALRQAVAALAAPMLLAVQAVDAAEPGSEAGVAVYGALALALIFGMYAAAPAAGAWQAARLRRFRCRRFRGGPDGPAFE